MGITLHYLPLLKGQVGRYAGRIMIVTLLEFLWKWAQFLFNGSGSCTSLLVSFSVLLPHHFYWAVGSFWLCQMASWHGGKWLFPVIVAGTSYLSQVCTSLFHNLTNRCKSQEESHNHSLHQDRVDGHGFLPPMTDPALFPSQLWEKEKGLEKRRGKKCECEVNDECSSNDNDGKNSFFPIAATAFTLNKCTFTL